MLKKIISGFQTGVDIAAIRAAQAAGLQTGGAMPRGFLTLEGPRPEYKERYGAYELPTAAYPPRTRENIAQASATLVLWFHASAGTRLTLCECQAIDKYPYKVYYNPRLEISRFKEGRRQDLQGLALWLSWYEVVNVAGNRDADEAAVQEWLTAAFTLALKMPE